MLMAYSGNISRSSSNAASTVYSSAIVTLHEHVEANWPDGIAIIELLYELLGLARQHVDFAEPIKVETVGIDRRGTAARTCAVERQGDRTTLTAIADAVVDVRLRYLDFDFLDSHSYFPSLLSSAKI